MFFVFSLYKFLKQYLRFSKVLSLFRIWIRTWFSQIFELDRDPNTVIYIHSRTSKSKYFFICRVLLDNPKLDVAQWSAQMLVWSQKTHNWYWLFYSKFAEVIIIGSNKLIHYLIKILDPRDEPSVDEYGNLYGQDYETLLRQLKVRHFKILCRVREKRIRMPL